MSAPCAARTRAISSRRREPAEKNRGRHICLPRFLGLFLFHRGCKASLPVAGEHHCVPLPILGGDGHRVGGARLPDITYDEQPLTWAESRKQRRRWSSGTIQVARLALPRVLGAMGEAPRLPLADLGATLMIPAYQLAALAGLACGALAAALSAATPAGALLAAAAAVLVNLLSAALTATLAAFILLRLEGRWDRRLLPALGLYWLFLLSWLPITVGSFLRGTTRWEEIRHTRNVTPEALAR